MEHRHQTQYTHKHHNQQVWNECTRTTINASLLYQPSIDIFIYTYIHYGIEMSRALDTGGIHHGAVGIPRHCRWGIDMAIRSRQSKGGH